MSATRVFVIDDSALFRDILRALLEADGDIQVIGEAATGEEAIARVGALEPDLVTLDVEMPGLGGLATIVQLMARRPVPILVLTGQPTGEGTTLAFDAIARGALELASKASLGLDDGQALRALVKQLGSVQVVRHPGSVRRPTPVPLMPSRVRPQRGCPVVAVAASSGGPTALIEALGSLPREFPGCVAVVQHLPQGFAAPFQRFLAERLSLSVLVVKARVEPRPGTLLLPDDDRHLILGDDGAFAPSDAAPFGGHRPSATLLFLSVARVLGAAAAGVILSGMGDDGVDGLQALRRAGGQTIAQDQATSAIYGMPRAAAEQGAAARVVPVRAIGALLAQWAGAKAS